ncbi:hypothetical protein AHAS_Ahas19G0182100 [Arachis hypogaea]
MLLAIMLITCPIQYTSSLFQERFLYDQFNQLQQLQDECNPEFIVEVVTLFFEDAERLLNELSKHCKCKLTSILISCT